MKRAYYFSLEYLMGRSLDNSLINLDVKEEYKQAISNLGFNNIEDILDAEHDAGLGNGKSSKTRKFSSLYLFKH